LNTFKAQLNAHLSEFNDNEDGYVYYIASDSRNYYQATNEEKLKGCETVTISVTCSDGATLGQGTTQYKCRKCGSTLNAHSKEGAMKTTAESEELDLSELDAMQREADNKVYALQSQISALEKENESLIKQIANASVEEAVSLRQKYNENKVEIDRLKPELAAWQQKQEEIAQAKEEAQSDNDVQTDDYYRIPAIMQDCLQYHLAGQWFLERLHLCPKRHNPEYQRHHHIQGDTENRPKAQILPWHQDTQGYPANIVGLDNGVFRYPCGGSDYT